MDAIWITECNLQVLGDDLPYLRDIPAKSRLSDSVRVRPRFRLGQVQVNNEMIKLYLITLPRMTIATNDLVDVDT